MLCLIILLAALIAAAAATWIAAVRTDRHFFGKRYDGNPDVRYFEASDFVGLQASPVSFPSTPGITLRGFLYRKEGLQPRALAVFVHGLGAGHLAYTTEIDFLARCGYLVLGFDMTGCGASDGRADGFDQGPLDIAAALRFVRSQPALSALPIVLVGHSWGAFSVMNALPAQPDVRAAVAICGFASSASAAAQKTFGRCAFLAPLLSGWLWLFNRRRFGKDANQNSLRSLRASNQPLLLLYGGQDLTVRYRENGARIRKVAARRANTKFILYPEKGHNAYLSDRAQRAMYEQFGAIPKEIRSDRAKLKDYYASLDYRLLTEEDPQVMQEIAAFLDGCLSARN